MMKGVKSYGTALKIHQYIALIKTRLKIEALDYVEM
jgi:hypothetical protein